mmetsp:Transcript_74602/g.207354  ORF Transcript_74602/g.207354 Transcript_74602/m.207354 type:complete len:204 (+) Transcript_74602:547-1158(+)
MATAPRYGRTEIPSRASTRRARRAGRVTLSLRMARATKASFETTTCMDTAFTDGATAATTRATGLGTTCTAKAFQHGKTAAFMTASMSRTRSTAMAFSSGPTGASTRETGRMGSSMALAARYLPTAKSPMASGTRVGGSNEVPLTAIPAVRARRFHSTLDEAPSSFPTSAGQGHRDPPSQGPLHPLWGDTSPNLRFNCNGVGS